SIFSMWGPKGLAAHYRRAANLYEKAGDARNSTRCCWAAFCLWPFSRQTFEEIVGKSAHPTLQRWWQEVRTSVPSHALRWLRRRLTGYKLSIANRGAAMNLTKRKDSMPTSISPIADSGLVEHIMDQGRPLAYIIRESFQPEKTTFLTPPEFKQQVGY